MGKFSLYKVITLAQEQFPRVKVNFPSEREIYLCMGVFPPLQGDFTSLKGNFPFIGEIYLCEGKSLLDIGQSLVKLVLICPCRGKYPWVTSK